MKKIIVCVFILICFCNCSEKKKGIEFTTLHENEFNAKPFALPSGSIPDARKKTHDSCMGFSFDANAMLIKTRDSFSIGNVVNRQSLAIADSLNNLGVRMDQLMSQFNVLTSPCYEKTALHFPLKSLMGNFVLKLSGADEALNKEINNALSASGDAEMQTGSWVYLDMKDALKRILDTVKSPAGLRYKANVLDTANMVLTTIESVTDVSFIINTQEEMSEPLQNLLKNKPKALPADQRLTIQVFYLSNNKFQMSLNGFFPVVGRFMKAELK